MSRKEHRRLIAEILKYRKLGWTELTRDLMRLMVKTAWENGQITLAEYVSLIKMLDDDDYTPPPPPPPGGDDGGTPDGPIITKKIRKNSL